MLILYQHIRPKIAKACRQTIAEQLVYTMQAMQGAYRIGIAPMFPSVRSQEP